MPQISNICFLGCALAMAVITPLGAADTRSRETVLHVFARGNDGAYPFAELIADTQGNLYSTAPYGGSNNAGIVFRLAPDGTESVLYTFTGGNDGGTPQGGLIMDKKGNLYSTTVNGGADGRGTVFELAPDGTETVLYSFTGGADGANPWPRLLMDKKGNLYGTALGGGTGNNNGAVFKLAPNGRETVLYSFCSKTNCDDGSQPYAPVIADSKGNLYGTTVGGGDYNSGVVYKVTPKGKETVLYGFTGGSDGGGPLAGLLMDSSGNLYGTAFRGGNSSNDGVVFKVTPGGTEQVLYAFCAKANCTDGATPNASFLIADKKGNLYGTVTAGGTDNDGAIFELAPDGTEKVLYSFAGGSDGDYPAGGLLMDKKGDLYGTTSNGGGGYDNCSAGCGTAYKLSR
jgi:uncharacterized repeat protein (TIGR03803 family)